MKPCQECRDRGETECACAVMEIFVKMHTLLMVESSKCDPAAKLTAFGEYIQDGFLALSSSIPCPHAQRVKELDCQKNALLQVNEEEE